MGVASVAAMSAADTNSPIVLLSDGAIFRPPYLAAGRKGLTTPRRRCATVRTYPPTDADARPRFLLGVPVGRGVGQPPTARTTRGPGQTPRPP